MSTDELSKITWEDAIIGYYTARNYGGGDKDKIRDKAANELAKLKARGTIATNSQYVGETTDEFVDRVVANMGLRNIQLAQETKDDEEKEVESREKEVESEDDEESED